MCDSVQYQISKSDLFDWLNDEFIYGDLNDFDCEDGTLIRTVSIDGYGIPVEHEVIQEWIQEWCKTMSEESDWDYDYDEITCTLTAQYEIPTPSGIEPGCDEPCGCVAFISLPANEPIPHSVRNLIKRREA